MARGHLRSTDCVDKELLALLVRVCGVRLELLEAAICELPGDRRRMHERALAVPTFCGYD